MNKKLSHCRALYLEGIRDGNVRAAVEAYTGERYTQHSTGVRDGVEGFVEFFLPFVERNPVRDIRLLRSIVDGNYVFVHAYQDINNGEARWITTDLFDTDDDDKVIEHWDVISAFTDESVNGHTQVDGVTDVTDLDKTESNKALVASFVEDVLVQHQTDKIPAYVSEDTYVQHNSQVPDGVEAFVAFMNGQGKAMTYKNVFKIIGQGNFVVVYSEVDLAGTGMAIFDIFRVENDKIVEHWDNMEPIPEGPQPNGGKF